MAETIQLTEDLAVAWEGDVEGYAPVIALWNRALTVLSGELKREGWNGTARLGFAQFSMLHDLIRVALERAGANGEQLKQGETDILAIVGGQRYFTSWGYHATLADAHWLHPPREPAASVALRSNPDATQDDVRCALSVEFYTPKSSPILNQRHEPFRNSDVAMTAWFSPGRQLSLRIGLLIGLYSNAARLSSLRLEQTGPTKTLDLNEIAPRLNVITGDNGLGKSFMLEAAWWMLTGTWSSFPAVPNPTNEADPFNMSPPAIVATMTQDKHVDERQSYWIVQEQGWTSPRTDPKLLPGLVVYARADGSISVWDSHRNVVASRRRDSSTISPPSAFLFSPNDLMHGLTVTLEDGTSRVVSLGLINDWREWQNSSAPQFELLKRILAALGAEDVSLEPGRLARPFVDDPKDIPTIKMGYGREVAVTIAPAGVKRAVTLAYTLAWAISENLRVVDKSHGVPARSVVLLIDEPETHLHPRWQRTILPSLLKALEVGFGEPKVDVQMFVATHSPLVLASLEPHFDPALDALWKLDLAAGEVKLERDRWYKRGTAGAWLTSDVFDLGDARSREAEQALNEARELIRARVNDPERLAAVTARLVQVLPEDDPMLTRWQAFVEDVEVGR